MRTVLAIALLLSVQSVQAQNRGWTQLGQTLGDGGQSASLRGVEKAAEIAYNTQNARALQSEAQVRQWTASQRENLAAAWQGIGLSAKDAAAVAATFELTPAQTALNERAKQEGFSASIAAARAAYDRYDYALANQLLVAAGAALEREQAEQRGLAAVSALGEELRAKDPLFAVKIDQLGSEVQRILASMPPDRWAAAIRAAYARLPAAPPIADIQIEK